MSWSSAWLVAAAIAGAVLGAGIVLLWLGRSQRSLLARLQALRSAPSAAKLNNWAVGWPLRRLNQQLGILAADFSLRLERDAQREQLLRSVIEAAPMAMVLFTEGGKILFANAAAGRLFFADRSPEGDNFLSMLAQAPEALRRAVTGVGDELLEIDDDGGERQTFHLAKRYAELDGEPVVLVLVENLTRELSRQELEVWKRLLRVIVHELNNSLAPVSSLVHSARLLLDGAPQQQALQQALDTIAERAAHLTSFVEDYARLARLPQPRCERHSWLAFFDSLRGLWPQVLWEVGAVESPFGWFDAAQLQQVMINLVKNALEAGSPAEKVRVRLDGADAREACLIVSDGGVGMSQEMMRNALLPFFSTKEHGTGVGLPLCREIIEAHGGSMRLRSGDVDGLQVWIRLPQQRAATASTNSRLTLTRQ